MKAKSKRQPCPIGIDCLLVAAVKGKPCPNREYCNHHARPWRLPYHIKTEDGVRCLEVINLGIDTEEEEKIKAGWEQALLLPFYYARCPDLPNLVLVVYTYSHHEESGWEEAQYLGTKYFMWAAAKLGMSFSEFRLTEFAQNEYESWIFDRV